jgi:hypothetical protein
MTPGSVRQKKNALEGLRVFKIHIEQKKEVKYERVPTALAGIQGKMKT